MANDKQWQIVDIMEQNQQGSIATSCLQTSCNLSLAERNVAVHFYFTRSKEVVGLLLLAVLFYQINYEKS